MHVVDPVPSITFDADCVPPDQQFDLFHDTTAPMFATSPVGDCGAFRATAVDYLLDGLLVSRLVHSAQGLRRTRQHIDTVAGNALAVQLHVRGGLSGQVGDSALALDSSHVGVLDLARPFHAVSSDLEVIWVVVPRSRVPAAGPAGVAGGLLRLHRRSPRGRVLTSAVAGLWRQLRWATTSDAPGLAQEFLDALEAILAPGDFAPGDSALGAAVRAHVVANLDDRSLGVDQLMSTFYCSRSRLYRMFEVEGGVARYIRQQRLHRCLDQLLEPTTNPPRIHEVARRWGFDSPSHFHRLFHQAFGVAPSEVRFRRTEPATGYDGTTASKIARFQRWAALG